LNRHFSKLDVVFVHLISAKATLMANNLIRCFNDKKYLFD